MSFTLPNKNFSNINYIKKKYYNFIIKLKINISFAFFKAQFYATRKFKDPFKIV